MTCQTAFTDADDGQIGLRPIQDLKGKHFRVPGYQRGYRWGEKDVKALLQDLQDFFCKPGRNKTDYYCLQPLVIKKLEGPEVGWEVVDGQQRLTTLCLILQCLTSEPPFQISYKTRPGSANFLKAPKKESSEKYIDYHFIWQAHESIQTWLDSELKMDRQAFAEGIGMAVRIIWYPLTEADGDSPVAVFTRLNAGKIPLTDSDLIRALILKTSQHWRLEMALEWDRMAQSLQDDRFWFFLQPADSDRPNRIELLFDLMVPEKEAAGDERATFRFISEVSKEDADSVWKEVREIFETLEEWYQDRTLYHLAGYLMATGRPIRKLLDTWDGCKTRSEFRAYLVKLIHGRLLRNETVDVFVSRLRYGNPEVQSTLLLFNVATHLEQRESDSRFAFDQYKKEEWNIEHIHSQTSDLPGSEKDQRKWLETALPYLPQQSGLKKRAKSLLDEAKWDREAFDGICKEALDEYEDASEAEHSLGNLTLLDEETNKSYKNALFPVKRERILSIEREGKFIPPATRNVFLKAYGTASGTPLRWTAQDRDDHQKAVATTLTRFFSSTDPRLP
jgi:hypothetical protein